MSERWVGVTYDSRCYDLAEHFLQDEGPLTEPHTKARCHDLALHIQQAVEDWFSGNAP